MRSAAPGDLERAYSAKSYDVLPPLARLIGIDAREIAEIVGDWRRSLWGEGLWRGRNLLASPCSTERFFCVNVVKVVQMNMERSLSDHQTQFIDVHRGCRSGCIDVPVDRMLKVRFGYELDNRFSLLSYDIFVDIGRAHICRDL